MTETKEVVVNLKEEEEKSVKVIEQEPTLIENGKKTEETTENEKKMDGTTENEKKTDEATENESEKEKDGSEMKEAKSPEEKKPSAIDRFLEWWRGKPTAQADLKDNKEEDNKEKTNGKTEKEDEEKTTEKEQGNGEEEDANKEVDIKEIRSSPTERRLEKIVEEQKSVGERAPLAQAEGEEEEEVLESALDSRSPIDQPVSEPTTSETVEAGKDTFELESPPIEDLEEKSENRKSARVETFVVLEKPSSQENPQTSEQEPVNIPSEHDEFRGDSHREESSTESEVRKGGSEQSDKMEDVIEEIHDDQRRESVKETWKVLEETPEKETSPKTYRVSYTIRTTTIDKTKGDSKPAQDDDDDERLFGRDVLLDSRPPQERHEGPPPENLEDEIQEEHAREDEAANEDIERFFKQCENDGPVVDETDSKPETALTPQTADDIFRKLHSWDDEPTDWWTITKKKKEYEEWMKPMKDGTIRRVIIPAVEIPYETCVLFITDWKHREEWDKTFSEIQVLKSDKQSKLIYCPVKKRDLTFETLDQDETDPPCHVMSWMKQDVIAESGIADTLTRKKQKALEFITHTCGIILRPNGDQATKITILCQLEGKVDRVLKNTFLAGHPKTWLRNLKKYYKKQQKQDNQKVVYL